MTKIHQSTGLSISYGDPVWRSGRRDILGSLTKEISEYSHKLSSFLGSASCEIGFLAKPEDLNEWAAEGLGRTINTSDHYGVGIWEGFVNEIYCTQGGTQIKIGPLLEIGNRIRAVYDEIDTSSTPPTALGRTETTIAEDLRSQARYGVLEQIISVGQVETTLAEQLRDSHLRIRKSAKSSLTINLDEVSEPKISLSCLGLGDLLDVYIYESLAGSGTQTVTDRIKDILASDPNGLFLIERVQENLFAVQEFEGDYPTGLSSLKELVTIGDANDDRWVMYIKPGREFVYRPAGTQIDYTWSVVENTMRNRAGNEIMPWTVEAGRWLRIKDFMTGVPNPDDIYEDTRAVFLEAVHFSAPNQITFEGGYVNTITQWLAKLGLGGSFI